jgi:predicted nucleic acid-binding protein
VPWIAESLVVAGARVLIDTSVWIDFLRGDASLVPHVDALRRAHRIVVCGQVLQEVLQGSRDLAALATLERQFSIWDLIEERPEDFREAGRIYARLRWKGVTVPPSDCLIAAVAKRARVQVYATDPDFDHIPGLTRHKP